MTAAAKPTPDISHVAPKAALIEDVAETLELIAALEPPATTKGRYALAKALDAALPARDRYRKEKFGLLTRHAKRDERGQPITQTVGGMTIQFDFGQGFNVVTPEVAEALAELNDEDVILPGVRMITHAELGACPITAGQERVLIRAGLLEDKEPE